MAHCPNYFFDQLWTKVTHLNVFLDIYTVKSNTEDNILSHTQHIDIEAEKVHAGNESILKSNIQHHYMYPLCPSINIYPNPNNIIEKCKFFIPINLP